MRNFLCAAALAVLVTSGAFSIAGCAGGGEDEVLQNDPEVSKQKQAEYAKQMEEAMKNRGKPVPQPGASK